MKLTQSAKNIRSDLSLKRTLIRLNLDLEALIRRAEKKDSDQIIYRHSHSFYQSELTNVQLAILFLEDRRFFVHRGVELRAVARILKRLVTGKAPGAISTLDQQLVRIVTGRYEKTLRRKIREALLALCLNARVTKYRIFYTYIHDSYFGYGLEGVEIASNVIFRKKAAFLSVEEACFVASLLARPLPKTVLAKLALNRETELPTPETIIGVGRVVSPNWAVAIDRRYSYVKNRFSEIPNNLSMR